MPPTLKYQADGGPGMVPILGLLKGSDNPAEDQKLFLAAQILFWIIGATYGHAKNFSVFLAPGGGYRLTPLYDVLTAQPSLGRRQIERKQMRLAMSAGTGRHYRVDEIHPRHFLQTAAAKVPESVARAAIAHLLEHGERAFARIEADLAGDLPEELHRSVRRAALPRLEVLAQVVGG